MCFDITNHQRSPTLYPPKLMSPYVVLRRENPTDWLDIGLIPPPIYLEIYRIWNTLTCGLFRQNVIQLKFIIFIFVYIICKLCFSKYTFLLVLEMNLRTVYRSIKTVSVVLTLELQEQRRRGYRVSRNSLTSFVSYYKQISTFVTYLIHIYLV